MATQLKQNGYTACDKDRLRQRIWLGKKGEKGFKSLMVEHNADGHIDSTHGVGESGETGSREQIDVWLDELIMNEKEARRKRKEQEDFSAGKANADAEAAKGMDAAFGGKDGRRARNKGSGAPPHATGTPMPPDFRGGASSTTGGGQQSTGSGHSAPNGDSWGWAEPNTREGKFTKHPRLNARPYSMALHVQKAWWVLSDFHETYFSEHEAPAEAPSSMADADEVEQIGFKVVKAASGNFEYAMLHRHDSGYKNFLGEQMEKEELQAAYDVYEGWRVRQAVSTVAAAAILISEGLDALPAPGGNKGSGATEIAQLSENLKAGAEAQASAMKETQASRNQDREAQRAHEKEEAAALRLLDRERMLANEKSEDRRHQQLLAMFAAQGGNGAAATAPPPPPPPPPPAGSSASVPYDSLDELLSAAGASMHAGTFSENEYTLTDVYAAFESNQLMDDLKDLIPAGLGVRRRVVTAVTRGRQS